MSDLDKINNIKNFFNNDQTDFLANDDYLEYLVLLNMGRNISKLNMKPTELETKIYSYNDKILSEQEKIIFEYKNILKYLNTSEKVKELSEKDLKYIVFLLEKIRSLLKDLSDYRSIYEAKKSIVKIQIKLNLNITFYTVVYDMLNEYNSGKELKR